MSPSKQKSNNWCYAGCALVRVSKEFPHVLYQLFGLHFTTKVEALAVHERWGLRQALWAIKFGKGTNQVCG